MQPLLQELSKPAMRQRHWDQITEITGHEMNVNDPEFRLADMLAAKLVTHQVRDVYDCDVLAACVHAKWLSRNGRT